MPVLTVTNRQRRHKVDANFGKNGERLLHQVCENLLKKPPKHLAADLIEEIDERGQFSLVFVSNKQIQQLNSEWMGKDQPTDVLSFPLNLEPPELQLPWEVGEIVISLDKALEQSAAYQHSFERELAFLFVHGALHVLGFDHMTAADEKDMFGRQKEILLACGFPRN